MLEAWLRANYSNTILSGMVNYLSEVFFIDIPRNKVITSRIKTLEPNHKDYK